MSELNSDKLDDFLDRAVADLAGGYVVYHAGSGTYELTPEQAEVLANPDSPVFIPSAWEVPSIACTPVDTIETFPGVARHHGDTLTV